MATTIQWFDTLTPTLLKLFTKYQTKTHPEAMAKTGIQIINWVVNGSPNESVVPPVLEGNLRGSGSVFVENKFVGGASGYPPKFQNKEYNGKKNEITIGFNMIYAAKWHENPFMPGPKSSQAGNVGDHYLSKHLKSDAKDIMAFYASLMRKDMKI